MEVECELQGSCEDERLARKARKKGGKMRWNAVDYMFLGQSGQG